MSDLQEEPVAVPEAKPPDWANSWMRWALETPGVERLVGKGVALLGFEGRRTGRRYRIPVSYQRDGDTVTIVTKRVRTWWRNFEDPIVVELRLAGRVYSGKAEIESDEEAALEFMTDYLVRRPVDAKAYGLTKEDVTREKIAGLIPALVLIKVEITPTD